MLHIDTDRLNEVALVTMTVGICGLGSIGQRHVRLLRRRALRGESFPGGVLLGALVAYREKDRPLSPVTADHAAFCEQYAVRQESDWDTFVSQCDAIVLCTPTSTHLPLLARIPPSVRGVFVEKPLARRFPQAGVGDLIIQHPCMQIGYQHVFDPLIASLEGFLSEFIDPFMGAQITWYESLPAAHPWEAFRDGYAARADLGGGVIACLSHEFEWVQRLYGTPASILATASQEVWSLPVEETAMIWWEYESEARVAFYLSFVPAGVHRTARFFGPRGTLEVDWQKRRIMVCAEDINTCLYQDTYDRDDLLCMEQDHFLSCVATGRQSKASWDTALTTLTLQDLAYQSIEEGPGAWMTVSHLG